MAKVKTLSFFIILAIAIFFNWPAPQISQKLIQWKSDGKWFKYQLQYDIFYRDEYGKGPTEDVLILIHGFPTSSVDWLKIWEPLKMKFGRLIALDMLGFGFSDKPSEHKYEIFEQADIVELLLGKLGINDVHMLAHDYGDTVVQELLHRHIERTQNFKEKSFLKIRTICLLNGGTGVVHGIFPETHIPKWSQKLLLNTKYKAVFQYLSNYWVFSRELSSTFGNNTQPSSDDLTDWWAIMRYKDGHFATPNLMQYITQRHQNRDRWVNALQNANVPVHFIYGPLDPINPHPIFAERYRTLLLTATIDTLPEVGHYVQWEAPEKMLVSYFKFLKSIKND